MALLEAGEVTDEAAILIPAVAADGSLFPIGKLEAHRRAMLHLAVSVFVFDETGALLVQQRALGKYHSGGLWANTCCTHPHWGEEPAVSARRRLQEELGLDLVLRPAGRLDYRAVVGPALVEAERVSVFTGRVDPTMLALAPDPSEVAAVRWATLGALQVEAAQAPQTLAPWLRVYLARWDELGL